MIRLCTLIAVLFFTVSSQAAETKVFNKLLAGSWTEMFRDSGSGDWQDKWFLDGEKAKVTNDAQAMTIDTSEGYAVLWTQQSFTGDMRIEYDFKRVDDYEMGVNIIYIQATGDGQDGHVEDITQWSDRRTTAAMSDYYNNMHTYHISYAAFQNNKTDQPKDDYIRGRRYLPTRGKRMDGTELDGAYAGTKLFKDHQWIHITIIKQAKALWVEFKHPDKTLLCHFKNSDKPGIEHGRVGFRLMPGHLSQFKNIKMMTAPPTGKSGN